MVEWITNLDFSILDFIAENLRCAFLDAVLPYITMLGDGGILWIATALVMLFFKRTRKTGLMMGAALIMGLIVGNLTLKPLVARIRPYDIRETELLVDRLSDFSFPSGHTLASFEASGVLMLRDKRFGIPALILACIIAFSRMYLFVHYPSDVLAGIILGLLFAYLGYKLVGYLFDKVEGMKKQLRED